jgi:hypothetical protein
MISVSANHSQTVSYSLFFFKQLVKARESRPQ